MKRRIILFLVAMVLIAASLLFVVGATETPPELKIGYCSLSFRDTVCIKYAVSAQNAENVTVLVWNEAQSEYVYGTHDAELTSVSKETIDGEEYFVFDYTALSAKQMTDTVYARAYATQNGKAYYSDLNKYSILQYAYNMLGKTSAGVSDEKLRIMLEDMLSYGASAQKYFDYKTDHLATDTFYQIKVAGGKLDDGSTHGLYLAGTQINVTAPTEDADGKTFSYWKNSAGEKIGTAAVCTLTVGAKNDIYTPVYVKYSAGLEFDSNGDGTCYIIGMGDCADTELVIPATSPTGDTVIGIDSSAFANEPIVSVSLPATIEEIGRRAFNGCASLTDVYYDGTEEEWNEISISTGNDVIENATKHFNAPEVETFTVTFVDYDGKVLKEETVERGKSATAPANPTRENYTFTGWDQTFDQVMSDLTVTAQYSYLATSPTLIVGDATASAGETVTVSLQIANNPGVAGAKFTVNYDSKLTLTNAVSGEVFSALDYTPPAALVDGCPFNWDSLDAQATADGTFLTLTFTVADSALAGEQLDVSVSYVDGDVYNTNLQDLSFDIVNGTVTIQ